MKEKINNVYNLIVGKELGILPGNLAYSFVLSVIPILTLIFYFLTSFNLPLTYINNFLNTALPKSTVEFLRPILADTLSINSLITIVLSIVVITNSCNSIIIASNTIYNFENASFPRRLIKSLVLSIILIILIAFIMIVPLFGRSIINLIGMFTEFVENHRAIIDSLYTLLQFPVSLLFMYLVIKLVYVIAPDDKVPGKYMTSGAIFTTISWLIITVLFSYYINNIARFDLVYGNLTNLIVLLIWFYILAYIFVIGMFLNRNSAIKGIEKTNTIKLEEIRKKVQEERSK